MGRYELAASMLLNDIDDAKTVSRPNFVVAFSLNFEYMLPFKQLTGLAKSSRQGAPNYRSVHTNGKLSSTFYLYTNSW